MLARRDLRLTILFTLLGCAACGSASNDAPAAASGGPAADAGSGADGGPSDRSPDAGSGPDCGAVLDSDSKNCGRCGHDCLGAACASGKCQATSIATGLNQPSGMAIRSGTLYVGTVGGIVTVPTSGGAPQLFAKTTDAASIVITDASRVYWAGPSGVSSCPIAGCAAPTVLSTVRTGGLAIDGDTLYMTAWDFDKNGTISSCDAATCTTPKVLYEYVGQPGVIAVRGGQVYWTGLTDISTCPISGCAGAPVELVTTGGTPNSLTFDATHLYWTTNDFTGATVKSCAPASCGNSVMTMFSSPQPTVGTLAEQGLYADGSRVFFTAFGAKDGAVMAVSSSASIPVATLAANEGMPRAIVGDAASVYWTNASGGELRRVAK